MDTPPLPQPKADRTPITLEQYIAYTPEKLELWDGFYDYGDPEEFKGFYLAVLANMGLHEVVSHVPLSRWVAAIQLVVSQNPKLNAEISEDMCDRFIRGVEDLQVVAEYLEN